MKFTEEAMREVETNYTELKEIANDMLGDFFSPIDETIKKLENNINNLTVDSIKEAILTLSIQSYKISEIKDKTMLKAELAETLKKEAYATSYTGVDGTVATKENFALLQSSPQIVTELLYDLVSSLAKTKLDEVHRVVDSLKSILMSRMQEMKMNMSSSTYEGD